MGKNKSKKEKEAGKEHSGKSNKDEPPPESDSQKTLAEISSPKDLLKVIITEVPRDRWRKPSNIIPSVAVLVALIAVCVSISQAKANREHNRETIEIMQDEAKANREHNRLSVKPIITF